jgi:hypothetical protein
MGPTVSPRLRTTSNAVAVLLDTVSPPLIKKLASVTVQQPGHLRV